MSGTSVDRCRVAFDDVVETVRGLLAQVVRDEVLGRHRIGVLLWTVKRTPDNYGEHAIERLAARLEVGADTLYRCALVAEQWPAADVEKLSLRKNRRGEVLSWSHFTALTRIRSRPARHAMVERCLAEAWAVRELAENIAAYRAGLRPSNKGESFEEQVVRAAVDEGVQTASRAVSQVDVFLEALDDRFTEGNLDETLFKRAVEAFESLQDRVALALSRLRQARASSSSRLRVPTRVGESSARLPAAEEQDEDDSADAPLPSRARL